jgi:hypothetical protein
VGAYRELSEALRRRLLGGLGAGDQKRSGPGGSEADSTRARSLRWVLRFTTTDGEDYVEQLAKMGAVILVPLPPENRECLIVPNLRKPGDRRMATDDDLMRLAGQVRFSDSRPDSVRAVLKVLGVEQPARTFWAFFPRGLEDELARKEVGYRNRRPENIAETVFHVRIRNGTVVIEAVDQTPKK